MKPLNELLASSSCHEKWSPLLEVAAREVFELMLGCQLTASTLTEEATLEITSMVGLAGQMCGVLVSVVMGSRPRSWLPRCWA